MDTEQEKQVMAQAIENIGNKILRFGVQRVGGCNASGVAVFEMSDSYYLVTVPQGRKHICLGVQQIVCYGKKGTDFYEAKTVARAVAKIVWLIENGKHK